MLFASLLIYLVISFFVYPRFFEKIGISRFLLIFYLCIFSINILTAEILSLINLLNQPLLFLTIQTLIGGILFFTLQHWLPISKEKVISVYPFSDMKFSKFEIIVLVVISATFIGFFMVGATTPINNNDSLATHLPRIFYWLQHGNFNYWTASNLWQLIYPINAHVQGLWLFLLGKSEYLFFLVQWFSLVIITASIFDICKSLGFSTTQGLISGLVGLSLPVVLLQIFSFQGDLTVTALVMVCISFLLHFSQSKKWRYVWPAFTCIILALGTKQTAFLVFPVFCLTIVYLLIITKNFKKFLRSSWLLLILFISLASFQFIQNLAKTDSLFGVDSLLTEENTSLSQSGEKALYVIPRYIYQFVGLDGLPRSIQPSLIQAKENIFKSILNPAGLDLEKEVFLQPGFDQNESFHYTTPLKRSEDTAWFGPYAILLIPLATLITLFSKNKLRRKYALLCLINSIIFLVLLIVQRAGWDPYQGRYFILAIIPFIPLVSILLPKNNSVRSVILGILLPASMMLIVNTLFYNDSKPIITAKTQNDIINNVISPLPEQNGLQRFFKKSLLKIAYPTEYSIPLGNIYEATYYDRLYYSNNSTAEDIEFINQNIPEEAPISLMTFNDPVEFALFGRNRSRIVNPITSIDDIDQGYLLISNSVIIPPNLDKKLVNKNIDYSIFYLGSK